jgi:hypothetical protein
MFRPLGIDNAWDMEAFKEGFEIRINRSDEDVIEFDLIGEKCLPSITLMKALMTGDSRLKVVTLQLPTPYDGY